MARLDIRKGEYSPIFYYNKSDFDLVITVTDDDDVAVDLSSGVTTFTVKLTTRHTTNVIQLTTNDALSISGAGNNIVTFSGAYDFDKRTYVQDLKNSNINDVILYGPLVVTNNVT